MEPLLPIFTAPLFPPLHGELIALLRGLAPEDWERPTVAGQWRVRDVAAHLLDGDLRTLAAYRDGHQPPPEQPVTSYTELVGLIDGLNASGVAFARRLSPRLLVELLETVGPMFSELMASLPPFGDATYPVAWAGEDRSENWMDVGRQYTEQWHHQMQLRDAVGAPGLLEPRWMEPLLDLSVRALPHAYAATDAPDGTAVVLAVEGPTRGAWSLVRGNGRWEIGQGTAPDARTTVHAGTDAAWRLFYNALPPHQARAHLRIEGDASLAAPLLATRSVMV